MTLRSQLLRMTALALIPFAAHAGDIQFKGIPYASDDAAKRQVIAAESVTIDGTDYPIAYHVLARSGDRIGTGTFAALTGRDGKVVTSADGSEHISADADFTSLIPKGGKLYSVTHFESRPGAMYVSELAQDADGHLTAVSTKPVDFSAFGGLWVPCAGSVTPWETHLGGEEYPADARALEAAASLDDIDDYDFPMARYEGLDPSAMTLDEFRAAYNPYRYGYPTEIAISDEGDATASKHFSMGRVAVELANVMPDGKTAYISDDGTNVGLFRFVADTAGDLSAGTLYAAKWVQTSAEGAGAADLDWVDLGHADDASIQAAIEKGTKFSDIFETAEFNAGGTCPEGFLSSNAEGAAECLKVKPGMEAVASRLETRRFASMMGATTEFRKMEGSTYNPDKHVLYLSMSEVSNGMESGAKDNKYDRGGRNDIQLSKNSCGAVYELGLDDSFAATTMKGLVAGKPLTDEQTAAAADPSCDPTHNMCGAAAEVNTCDIDGIANPDNITYLPGYGTLVIGEDTGSGHQNDAIWAMNVGTGELTRIFSTPYGSETTSPYWYPDINGHGYLMAVVQHPYGESDEDKLADAADARAYVGYIGPFPPLAQAGN
ncbi:PhoX family phosphatase [Mangrovicoccus sp. HB161399]|uniref:PhoX family protein n=1 Tax=Mangrovicoccus sp. HB161399 TaxID=2720392 RepID=UPI0015524C0F|nr:alkaline phosphatase PhoX [Mangrovicoccus sp. HB161399]